MKISYNWLCQYLPQEIPLDELSETLTNLGLEVSGVEKREAVQGGLKGLVVGYVEDCVPHENADKLQVTTVAIGVDEPLNIVCGAPNVAAGQKVIVATVGTTLYGKDGQSFKIKKAKLRGVSSRGMICAEDEIGMGQNHDGILVLPEDTPVGLPAADYFHLPQPDFIIDIDLTPNRSDANSHIGVAEDVAAYLSYRKKELLPAHPPQISKEFAIAQPDLPLDIQVDNTEDCPRYAGLVLKNVAVQPSPEWLQDRLKAIDVQPINNIVDVTNFVLHEFGQPLHAFDYDKIKGQKIIIKNLKTGTPFTTLDGEKQKLNVEDLMICDGDGKPMCMAGIYGGIDSGITENTKTIFLESAYFHPKAIRRSSLRHHLRTDAATHFEKGVAMKKIMAALKRAATLIEEFGGGQVAHNIIDHYPSPIKDKKIELNWAYLEKICGKTYDHEAVTVLLKALGFSILNSDKKGFKVGVPGENQDIHEAADLAEEVLRVDGINNVPIPDRLDYTLSRKQSQNKFRRFKEQLASFLAYSGLQEIITNSISSSQYYETEDTVKLLNSLSSELDIMRPKMLESGLEVIAYNQNRKMKNLRLFEFGKTYTDKGHNDYEQTEWLSIWTTGNSRPQHWEQKAEKTDVFELKGIMTTLFSLAGLKKVLETAEGDSFTWTRGRQDIGYLTTVSAKSKKTFGIKNDVFFGKIHLANLYEATVKNKIKFQAPPKYPAVTRDLAIIVPKETEYAQVKKIVGKQKWNALRNFDLFDIFEHEKIGKNNKSMALSFTFQLNDRTLTDDEVDNMMNKLMKDYKAKLKATIRI